MSDKKYDCQDQWKPIENVSHEMLLLVININDGFLDVHKDKGEFTLNDVIEWATKVYCLSHILRLMREAGGCAPCAFRRCLEYISAQLAMEPDWVRNNFPEVFIDSGEMEEDKKETIH
jgi:hypothetical protein